MSNTHLWIMTDMLIQSNGLKFAVLIQSGISTTVKYKL